MPFTLTALISARTSRLQSRSTTSSRNHQKLYFAPGSHTHDRHTIPPDQLHISLSDPVLVAAEERLANVPDNQRRSKLSMIKESGVRKTINLVFRLKSRILSQSLDDHNEGTLTTEAVSRLTMATSTQGITSGNSLESGFHGAAAQGANVLDPSSNDPCDIAEVMTITSLIDVSPGNAGRAASENSRHDPDLAPLASETFKEELYVRGYLKRPASRPVNVVPRKSRTNSMFMSRKVFPKVLGRRRGRKIAESLRVEQDAAKTPDGSTMHLSEKRFSTIASATLRVPHADGLESPGTDTTTSASESFDLHEFSYITAFTTPLSSPSAVFDVETLKKGVDLGDRKHAV